MCDTSSVCLNITASMVFVRYWKSIAVLLEHVNENGKDSWWPWVAEHVLSGDMERSYLAYILASDTHLQALGGEQNVVVLHVNAHK